ncbi:hypothetical protein N9B49_00260 [bacterium]|nr:hypothetical protein [bacterium]
MKKLFLLSLSLFLLVAFTGCESTGANKSKSDDEGEYEYVTSTNSRIPRKVRKGSSYNQDSGSSPLGTVSGQKAKDYIGSGGPGSSQGND